MGSFRFAQHGPSSLFTMQVCLAPNVMTLENTVHHSHSRTMNLMGLPPDSHLKIENWERILLNPKDLGVNGGISGTNR